MTAKVSIVMPVLNCGPYLDEAIQSVLNQTHKDLELIIIDGGSSDSTGRVIKKYAKNACVKYMIKKGYGISKARNHGISMSRGEYIAFLDGDDVFLKRKIERQAGFLRDNPNVDICYTNKIYFNADISKEHISTYYNFSGDIFYFIKRNNFIHPSAAMAKRDVFKNDLFDETLPSHEDWELFLRMAYKGMRFSFIDEPLTKIRVRPGSVTTQDGMRETRRRVGLMGKDYWRNFKRQMNLYSKKGLAAVNRYCIFKTRAILLGFPRRKCFNRITAQEIVGILNEKYR